MNMDHLGISVRADYLAISKTDPLLFISGKYDNRLFSIDLDTIAQTLEKAPYNTKVGIQRD